MFISSLYDEETIWRNYEHEIKQRAFKRGWQEGIAQGRAIAQCAEEGIGISEDVKRGIETGVEQGIEAGIQAAVEGLKFVKVKHYDAVQALMVGFHLSYSDATEKVDQYWE